jgi:hypothetical protein
LQGMSLAYSPFLPSTLAILFDRGSSLTVFCPHCSFHLKHRYSWFRKELELALPSLDSPLLPTTDDKTIRTALEILSRERERQMERQRQRQREEVREEEGCDKMEVEKNEDCDMMGDSIRASAADRDEDMVDQAAQPQAPVDNALEILVHNVTEEFGFAPRDVYSGLLGFSDMKKQHAIAVRALDYARLETLVAKLSEDHGADDEEFSFSHKVIAMYPRVSGPEATFDDWAIDFKSVRIARQVVESMRLQEDAHLRRMYNLFYSIPGSSTLAGWCFEAIAHRLFSEGWKSGCVPQAIPMASDGEVPPVFSTTSPAPAPDTSFTLLCAEPRVVARIDFNDSKLMDVTLDPKRYYIPNTPNHPLFDSFTIGPGSDFATVISILQITTSETHKGSGEGYLYIRNIIRRVRALLKEKNPETKAKAKAKVKVTYCLVLPDDESKHQWRCPLAGTSTISKSGKKFPAIVVPTIRRRSFGAITHGFR